MRQPDAEWKRKNYFYKNIEILFDEASKHDIKILLGGISAKIGIETTH